MRLRITSNAICFDKRDLCPGNELPLCCCLRNTILLRSHFHDRVLCSWVQVCLLLLKQKRKSLFARKERKTEKISAHKSQAETFCSSLPWSLSSIPPHLESRHFLLIPLCLPFNLHSALKEKSASISCDVLQNCTYFADTGRLLIEASHRGFSSRCIWEIVLYALDSSDYADSSSVQRSASCQICLPLDHTDWDECLLVFLTKGSCKESSFSKRGWNEWKKPCDATSKEEEMQSNMNQWKLSRSRSSFCQFARQGILPSIRHSTALDRRRVSDWNQHNNMNTGFWTSLWV